MSTITASEKIRLTLETYLTDIDKGHHLKSMGTKGHIIQVSRFWGRTDIQGKERLNYHLDRLAFYTVTTSDELKAVIRGIEL